MTGGTATSREPRTGLTWLIVVCAAFAALRVGANESGSWLALLLDGLALPILATLLILPLLLVALIRWGRQRPPSSPALHVLRVLILVSIPAASWCASSGAIRLLERSGRLDWTISDATMLARYSEKKAEFDALGTELRERLTSGRGSDESLTACVEAIGIRVVAIDLKKDAAYLTIARNSTLSWTRVKGFAYSIGVPGRVVEDDTDTLKFSRSEPPVFRRIDDHWYIFVGPGAWR